MASNLAAPRIQDQLHHPKPSLVQEVATKGPSRAYDFSQAPEAREVGAIQPQTDFLDQNIFHFTQPASVSGMAFRAP